MSGIPGILHIMGIHNALWTLECCGGATPHLCFGNSALVQVKCFLWIKDLLSFYQKKMIGVYTGAGVEKM